MERCNLYIEQMSAYIDGELDYQDEIALFVHLEACPLCRQRLHTYQLTSQALSHVAAEPSPVLLQNVMTQIGARPQVLPFHPRRPRHGQRFAAVAAVFAVVALVGFSAVWGGLIPGAEFSPADGLSLFVPPQEPAASAPAPPAEDAPLIGEMERFSDWAEDVYEYDFSAEAEAEEDSDGIIIPLDAPLPEMFDTTLLDKFLAWENWSWAAITRDLARADFSYELTGDTFIIRDFQNPDSYLYGTLHRDSDSPEEAVVSLMGYRLRAGNIDRRVEIRITSRGASYYYAVPRPAEGGIASITRERLLDFIVFG